MVRATTTKGCAIARTHPRGVVGQGGGSASAWGRRSIKAYEPWFCIMLRIISSRLIGLVSVVVVPNSGWP